MSIKMLIFDYKEAEENFFETNKFDDFDITFFEDSLDETTVNNLPDNLKDEVGIISVFITSRINTNVLNQFKNLLILTTRSTGYDHIDINACTDRRIKVINVEDYGSHSVVQYTIGLMLALVRKIIPAINDTKNFHFNYQNYIGRELNELTLGVFGTGAIGTGVCKIANDFNMKIYAYDIRKNKELIENYNVEYADKNFILENSDIISLHLPLNESTKNFISKMEFAKMKSSSYIINVSRGELINTESLYNALTNKTIAGVGLDVIECENIGFAIGDLTEKIETSKQECVSKVVLIRRLAQMENVLITPHVAYNTQDSINRILNITFNAIKDCIQGGHSNQIN